MRSQRPGPGSDTAPAWAERTCRCANSSGGDDVCEAQHAAGCFAASSPNPRIRIRSRASAHRRARGEIAQAERIPARTKVVKRAETDAAQIPRAQDRSGVVGTLSPPGKARENNPEKTAPACCKVDAISRSD